MDSNSWQILTLDNLILWGHTLVNQCCMCCCNEETVDYLLLHFLVAHSLWVHMLQFFGIQWVMPGSMESLVFCWSYWLRKFNLDIWNLVPSCLMLIIWMERNWRSFEDIEKSLALLQALCQKTLFDWSWCWGSSNYSSSLSFILLLVLHLEYFPLLFVAFACVHHHEHLVFAFFFFTSWLTILLLPIKRNLMYVYLS